MKNIINYLFDEIPYGFILFPAIILICFSCEVCHAQEATPIATPQPTPADDDAEGWFGVIQESPDCEFKIAEYWDPITTGKGTYEEPKTYYFWSDTYDKAVAVDREYSEGLRDGVLCGLIPLGWSVYEFTDITPLRMAVGGGKKPKKPDDITDIKPGSGQKPGSDYIKMKAAKKHSATLIAIPEKIIPGRTPWKSTHGKPTESEMWVKTKAVTP